MCEQRPVTRWLRDPLVVFLAAGAVLFGIFAAINPAEPDADPRTIVVDRDSLLTYMQFRARAFDPERFEQLFAELSGNELDALVDDYTREEALYREARDLQLGSNDYVARLRLIQQLEFMLKGFVDAELTLTDAEVEAYWQAHREAYREPAKITFTHVFFSRERHGDDAAAALAAKEIAILNDRRVPFEAAAAHGDRFPYHLNYVDRGRELVASHFGPELTAALFDLAPAPGRWHGPFASPLGYHLVQVTGRDDPRQPELAEVRDRVIANALEARRGQLLDGLKADIVGQYRVDRSGLYPAGGGPES